MKRSTFAAAWLSAFVLASAPDMAHAGVPVDLPEALFLPVGVNVGGVFYGDQPDGFLIGGEVSIVKTGGILWYGGYADGVWDTLIRLESQT